MNELQLRVSVDDFQRVIEEGERISHDDDRLGSAALAMLFAMKSAYAVRGHVRKWEREQFGTETIESHESCGRSAPEKMPRLSNVRIAAPKIVAASRSKRIPEMLHALYESGVTELCPVPDKQLLMMDTVGRRLKGRPLQVSLVELANFSVETGDIARAEHYVAEAYELAPTGWELHNLCVLEGLFFLRSGDTREAVGALDRSLSVCLADEFAAINCGVRAPNLKLAQAFLEHGESRRVVRYLSQCMDIWQSFLSPINKLIALIESGAMVDLQTSEFVLALSRTSYMLQMQWVQARVLNEATESPETTRPYRTAAEIVAARRKVSEDCERFIKDRVERTIRYLDTEEPER